MKWTYWHTPRGGYGYKYPVNAKILGRKKGRVKVELQKSNGETVQRWVKRSSVKRRR